MNKLIDIGKIGKPHGLLGEMHFFPVDDVVLDYIDPGDYLMAKGLPYQLSSVRNANSVLIKFKEIIDRTGAELLRGAIVQVPWSEELEGEIHQAMNDPLVGFTIIDHATHQSIGTIINVVEMAAQLLAVVHYNNREILIPIHDDLIISEDVKKRILVMNLPDGLLDL